MPPLFYESDINIFFSDWAIDATYTPQGGQASAIKAIFDNSFDAVNLTGGVVESASPQATVKTTDVPNAKHGDTLNINSITYKIIGIHPDATGITLLILSKD